MRDAAEDAGRVIPPVKDDNKVPRKSNRKDCSVFYLRSVFVLH